MDNLKDKAAKGVVWGTLNNFAIQILNAVFGIVLARILGREDYGVIGLLYVFSQVATAMQDSGFVIGLTNKKNATHSDYNSVFWFNVGMSAILYVILFFCAPLISAFYDEPVLTSLSRFYFIAFFIASLSIVPRAILFRELKQKELAIMGLISLVMSGSVGIAMAMNDMAYWGIATQQITFNLCVTILSWVLSHWRPSFNITFQPVRELFGFSSKMLITDIIERINNNVFSVLLGRFYNTDVVGTYNQANKWTKMGSDTITGIVNGVAQPTFVQVGDDKARLCRTFRKMLRFTCFISFPAMFGLALITKDFIIVLITDKWLPSARLMQIFCVGSAFLPIAKLYYSLIISRGKSNVYMYNVMGQGCTIIASLICVHYLFAEEVCLNIWSLHLTIANLELMMISYAVIITLWTLVWHAFLKHEIGISFRDAARDIVPFLALAAMAMILTYIITMPIANVYLLLVSRIIIAAIIYLGSLWLLGAKILRECVGYVMPRFPFLSRLMR